ncbi:RWD domain-containing protein 3 isoform X1 [Gambusia affinis]|uniref:RWD domain-containing protein 3 isoform X1 n=1 Tax=Gambusia affinis TaxID=33528 RepID=UPI001CDBEBC8|nr:RWD domain-containing protein 3 isoform X1 [Gambusia affinis]
MLIMSDAAIEEVSVLSSIYCRDGEFQIVQQSAQDGLVVQLNCTGGRGGKLNVSAVFHLDPSYPSCPPHISISTTSLSKIQCHNIRQKLMTRAAELPPEPMLLQLVEYLQECVEQTEDQTGEQDGTEEEKVNQQEWTTVLLLDHIRSQNRYIKLLERWSQQLHLTCRLLLGRNPLIILLGERLKIKEFCHRLKTVKVDVDSSGKKCKERMMKVLAETPYSSLCQHSFQRFVVKDYKSLSELTAVFEELNLAELYQQMLPTLSG